MNYEIDIYNKFYNKMHNILKNLYNYENIKSILNLKNMKIIKDINIFLKENIRNTLKYLMNKLDIKESTLINR